jgi:hypothetical protein
MISLILLSIGSTTLVAFLMAMGFFFISPSTALAVFFITFALEWIIMEPLNRIIRLKTIRAEGITFSKLAKYESATGKQSVVLECEYCNEPNALKIDLNGQNAFICTKCGNGNKVITQFTTVRSTNPLDTIKVTEDPEIIDELSELEA